jgi:anti-sigma regulatory factor (Ser/Thr protein kinase)
MTEVFSARLPQSQLTEAINAGRFVIGSTNGVTWRELSADPRSVKAARDVAISVLALVAATDQDHVDDVVVVVSELVTNAVTHPTVPGPVHLGISPHERWTHVMVQDPDAKFSAADKADCDDGEDDGDEIPQSGRGWPIVRKLSVIALFVAGRHNKTAHAIVLRSGLRLTDLTDEERDELTRVIV